MFVGPVGRDVVGRQLNPYSRFSLEPSPMCRSSSASTVLSSIAAQKLLFAGRSVASNTTT
jgi:hypothetical protein